MRIVFLGTPKPAVPTLSALIRSGHEIPLVVTQPDRPVGRSSRPVAPPVKVVASAAGLQVIQPVKVRTTTFREALAAARPDLLVVVAYGRILPRRVLELPRHGPVNVHFSLLPRLRGAAPVQWALAGGADRTGVTAMLMNERMDEGDILMQSETDILAGEHAPALQERLAGLGADLLLETVQGIESGCVEPRAQDHAAATYAPLLTKRDGETDPALPAREIEGRIRGFDPWPGAWMRRRGKRLRLVSARALPDAVPAGAPPGTVIGAEDGRLVLVCGEGTRLMLERIQPEGRRAVSARDARHGRQLEPGDLLEHPAKTG